MKQNPHEWTAKGTQKIFCVSSAVVLAAVIEESFIEDIALELDPKNAKFFLRDCKKGRGLFRASRGRRNQCEQTPRVGRQGTH